LAQVFTGVITTAAVVEAHVVRVHIVNVQVAVRVVVAIRLVVTTISQPPSAAVSCPPRTLLRHAALHGILRATATSVSRTSDVNDEVRLPRVVVNVLAHGVVHRDPVILVTRGPDLPSARAGIRVATAPHATTIPDSEHLSS